MRTWCCCCKIVGLTFKEFRRHFLCLSHLWVFRSFDPAQWRGSIIWTVESSSSSPLFYPLENEREPHAESCVTARRRPFERFNVGYASCTCGVSFFFFLAIANAINQQGRSGKCVYMYPVQYSTVWECSHLQSCNLQYGTPPPSIEIITDIETFKEFRSSVNDYRLLCCSRCREGFYFVSKAVNVIASDSLVTVGDSTNTICDLRGHCVADGKWWCAMRNACARLGKSWGRSPAASSARGGPCN